MCGLMIFLNKYGPGRCSTTDQGLDIAYLGGTCREPILYRFTVCR